MKPKLFRWVLGYVVVFMTTFVHAQAQSDATESRFKEGIHYVLVKQQGAQEATGDQVLVREFFSYGCPHCFNLEPSLHKWSKNAPEYVQFERVPTAWNDYFKLLAQAYYTAELLNVDEGIHMHIFNAIHRARKNLQATSGIRAVMVDFGVDGEAFDKTFSSFGVDQKVRVAVQLFGSYQILGQPAEKNRLSSVPTIVVANQYATDVSKAGGHEPLLGLLDVLVAKAYAKQANTASKESSEKTSGAL